MSPSNTKRLQDAASQFEEAVWKHAKSRYDTILFVESYDSRIEASRSAIMRVSMPVGNPIFVQYSPSKCGEELRQSLDMKY